RRSASRSRRTASACSSTSAASRLPLSRGPWNGSRSAAASRPSCTRTATIRAGTSSGDRMKRGTGILVGAIASAIALSGVATGAGSSTAALAFATGTNSAKPTVWVADAHGHNARKVGGGDFPIISPNGKMVAVSLFGRNGGGGGIYNVAGGKLGTFVKNGTPLAWSPDSRYLAVSVFDPVNKGIGKSGLSVVDTQTKATTVIAKGQISGASFDPAGSGRLVYGLAKSE